MAGDAAPRRSRRASRPRSARRGRARPAACPSGTRRDPARALRGPGSRAPSGRADRPARRRGRAAPAAWPSRFSESESTFIQACTRRPFACAASISWARGSAPPLRSRAARSGVASAIASRTRRVRRGRPARRDPSRRAPARRRSGVDAAGVVEHAHGAFARNPEAARRAGARAAAVPERHSRGIGTSAERECRRITNDLAWTTKRRKARGSYQTATMRTTRARSAPTARRARVDRGGRSPTLARDAEARGRRRLDGRRARSRSPCSRAAPAPGRARGRTRGARARRAARGAEAHARGDDAGAARASTPWLSKIPETRRPRRRARGAGLARAAERARRSRSIRTRALEARRSRTSAPSLCGRARGARVAQQGDAAAARAAWRGVARARARTSARGATRLALAESLAGAGRDRRRGARAARGLDRAAGARGRRGSRAPARCARSARPGRSLRAGADWVRRGDRLFERQRSEDALAAYDAALAARIDGADRAGARREAAQTACSACAATARPTSAFAALGDDADARVWRARSLARADRVDEAIAQLDAIGGERSAHRPPGRATSRACSTKAAATRSARVRSSRAVVEGADEQVATQALWRLGWSA